MVVNDNSFSVVGCVAGVTNIWVFLDVIVDFVGVFFLSFFNCMALIRSFQRDKF